MYLEIVVQPKTGDVQFCAVTGACLFPDASVGAHVVIVFTTPSEANAALQLAGPLAQSAGVRILVLCPITRSLIGILRLSRFARYAKRCTDSLAAGKVPQLRMVVWPCHRGQDVVEEFTTARSIVIFRRRWWRPWGRNIGNVPVMKANTLSLVL